MSKNDNLVDVKPIMWLLERFLRNATDKERAYFGLEVNRMYLSFQSEPEPKPSEPEPNVPKPKPSVPELSTDLRARLQIPEQRAAINKERKIKGLVQYV
jgi:hypothetical protein